MNKIKKEVIPVQKELLDELVDKAEKFDQIKQQLAEKDKEISDLRACEFIATTLDFNKLSADNCRLREQLAEKDEEIEKFISALEYNENNIPNQRRAIRHQVCDEIRDYIHSRECKVEGMEFVWLLSKLDEIEKGKAECN